MENRRPPTDKPFPPRKIQDNSNKEGSNFRYNQNPNNRYPPREGSDRFQPRDNGGRTNNYPPRLGQDNRDSRDNRDNRPRDPRDNRSFGDNRDNRGGQPQFRQGTGKFVPRSGPNNSPNNNPNNRFAPRGKFPPGSKPVKPYKPEDDIKIVADTQVTDGKHKGKYLVNTVSEKAKLTPRRIREAMFKILSRKIRAGRFLDLCAGSGTIGIEAISRGAINSTFVERSVKMCSFIKKNLAALEIKEGHGDVVEIEAVPFLIRMQKRRRFWDVVYLDPPSGAGFEEIFIYLSRGAGISPGGVLVVEHPSEVFLPEKSGVLKRWRVVVQGDRAISFFERK